MRSTLIKPRRRGCPQCWHLGFAKIGLDYFKQPLFECNSCRHVWATDRGPMKGTSLDRPQLETEE